MVEGDGFEPPNPKGADLQSAAFSHFATPPIVKNAGERNRTPNLLITSQLLYQLSYTGAINTLNHTQFLPLFKLLCQTHKTCLRKACLVHGGG